MGFSLAFVDNYELLNVLYYMFVSLHRKAAMSTNPVTSSHPILSRHLFQPRKLFLRDRKIFPRFPQTPSVLRCHTLTSGHRQTATDWLRRRQSNDRCPRRPSYRQQRRATDNLHLVLRPSKTSRKSWPQ